jgi:hypothetical protein
MESCRKLSLELLRITIALENSDVERRQWRLRRQATYPTRDDVMAYSAILHSSAVVYSEDNALYTLSPEESIGTSSLVTVDATATAPCFDSFDKRGLADDMFIECVDDVRIF